MVISDLGGVTEERLPFKLFQGPKPGTYSNLH